LYVAVPECGPALSNKISLLPELILVRETFPPIFHVQLAVVAAELLTPEILAAVPGPIITSPATLIMFDPDVVAIPLSVAVVTVKLPAMFNVVLAAGPPLAEE
jgi:hypothetical protein